MYSPTYLSPADATLVVKVLTVIATVMFLAVSFN